MSRSGAWPAVGAAARRYIAVLLVLALGGCRPQPAAEPDWVQSVAERGPLKLVVEARPKQVWLGDPILVVVQLHTPDDYDAALPAATDFGTLSAQVTDAPDPRPGPAGGLDWRRTFVLESYSSGPLEIPPLVVKYGRKLPAAQTQPAPENELVSGTLKLEVRSALTSQDTVTKPRDITGTLMPPPTWGDVVWIAALSTLILAALVAGTTMLWRWHQRRRREIPPVLPEIWALRMLAELERQDWLAAGRAREFYYRLSETVRAYIEKKFALAAPEMTTEEFLVRLARDRSALPYDTNRLRAFLEACDLVKYAAFSPRREHAEQALSAARAFVHETAAAAARWSHRLETGATPAGERAA